MGNISVAEEFVHRAAYRNALTLVSYRHSKVADSLLNAADGLSKRLTVFQSG